MEFPRDTIPLFGLRRSSKFSHSIQSSAHPTAKNMARNPGKAYTEFQGEEQEVFTTTRADGTKVNKFDIYCPQESCRCKMLLASAATLVQSEKSKVNTFIDQRHHTQRIDRHVSASWHCHQYCLESGQGANGCRPGEQRFMRKGSNISTKGREKIRSVLPPSFQCSPR